MSFGIAGFADADELACVAGAAAAVAAQDEEADAFKSCCLLRAQFKTPSSVAGCLGRPTVSASVLVMYWIRSWRHSRYPWDFSSRDFEPESLYSLATAQAAALNSETMLESSSASSCSTGGRFGRCDESDPRVSM